MSRKHQHVNTHRTTVLYIEIWFNKPYCDHLSHQMPSSVLPLANSQFQHTGCKCKMPGANGASHESWTRLSGSKVCFCILFHVPRLTPFLSCRRSCRCPPLSQPAEREETAAAAEAVVFWARARCGSRNYPRTNRIHRIWFLALCTRWEISAAYSSSIWGQSLGSMKNIGTLDVTSHFELQCALRQVHSPSSWPRCCQETMWWFCNTFCAIGGFLFRDWHFHTCRCLQQGNGTQQHRFWFVSYLLHTLLQWWWKGMEGVNGCKWGLPRLVSFPIVSFSTSMILGGR